MPRGPLCRSLSQFHCSRSVPSRGRQQALEAGGARRILNDTFFFSAPQLKRDPLCGTSSAGVLALTPHEELFALAEKLKKAAGGGDSEEVAKPIGPLEEAAQKIGRSFSG